MFDGSKHLGLTKKKKFLVFMAQDFFLPKNCTVLNKAYMTLNLDNFWFL